MVAGQTLMQITNSTSGKAALLAGTSLSNGGVPVPKATSPYGTAIDYAAMEERMMAWNADQVVTHTMRSVLGIDTARQHISGIDTARSSVAATCTITGHHPRLIIMDDIGAWPPPDIDLEWWQQHFLKSAARSSS